MPGGQLAGSNGLFSRPLQKSAEQRGGEKRLAAAAAGRSEQRVTAAKEGESKRDPRPGIKEGGEKKKRSELRREK